MRAGVAGGHARLQRGQLRLGAPGGVHPLADVPLQREVGAEGRALVVQGDPRAARQAHPPGVRRQQAGEDAQQGRLALAVAADHGQAVARVHAEADAVEDVARPERLDDLDRLHSRLG